MGVSKNRGIPKSSHLIGFSIINHPFWGTPIFWKHPYISRVAGDSRCGNPQGEVDYVLWPDQSVARFVHIEAAVKFYLASKDDVPLTTHSAYIDRGTFKTWHLTCIFGGFFQNLLMWKA